jgi:DNA repair exonuclease SbcCD ATPase subunit
VKILNLEIDYFLGFGENQKIEFKDQQVIGIIGEYEESEEKSNRAGKSSFLEAILYNLYGKTRSKNIINWNFPDESMSVTATYEFNGKIITIRRGKNQSNDSFLEVDGFEGEKKLVTQEELNKMVGCNYDDFIALNYFMQGDIHKFISSGSTSMGSMLTRWLNTDYWGKYKSITDSKIKNVESQIQELMIFNKDNDITLEVIKSYAEEKKGIETNIDSDKGKLDALRGYKTILKAYTKIAEEVAEETIRGKKLKVKKERLEEKLDNARARFKKVESDKKKSKLLKSKMSSEYTKNDLTELNKEIKSKEKRITILEKNIKDWKEKISNIENGDTVCPITDKVCKILVGKNKASLVKEITQEKSNFEKQLSGVEKELKDLELKYKKISSILESNQDIELEIAKLNTEASPIHDEIKELMEELDDSGKEIVACAVKINKNLRELKKCDKKKMEEMENALDDIEELEENIEKQTKVIGEYNLKIKNGNKNIKQIRENKREIRILEKELKHLKFISFMFGKSGIPSNQIESAFGEVEADANYILKNELKTDIQIEFRNYKELSDKETVCPACGFAYPKGYRKTECENCGKARGFRRKDELSLKMFVNGNESDFESDSGGGKVLVSISLRVALIRMLRRRTGIGCSMLFLDEIFAMLDKVNRKNIMKLILETLSKDFEFEQIFCISHQADVSEALRDNVLITKHSKYSDVCWCE